MIVVLFGLFSILYYAFIIIVIIIILFQTVMVVNYRKICLLTVDTYYFNIILTYCNIDYAFLVVLYLCFV